jgi:hypothetical protein
MSLEALWVAAGQSDRIGSPLQRITLCQVGYLRGLRGSRQALAPTCWSEPKQRTQIENWLVILLHCAAISQQKTVAAEVRGKGSWLRTRLMLSLLGGSRCWRNACQDFGGAIEEIARSLASEVFVDPLVAGGEARAAAHVVGVGGEDGVGVST